MLVISEVPTRGFHSPPQYKPRSAPYFNSIDSQNGVQRQQKQQLLEIC